MAKKSDIFSPSEKYKRGNYYMSQFGEHTITDRIVHPWSLGIDAQKVGFSSPKPNGLLSSSPSSTMSTPDSNSPASSSNSGGKSILKRGRPRADSINSLICDSNQGSAIKCKICQRTFPRDKSLQAHMRTHTGERPYLCDYPGCVKSFCQSGQLKTHQRLHTGEKPFACTVEGCKSRFTHANRHCPEHPMVSLRRLDSALDDAEITKEDLSPQVAAWFERYRLNQEKMIPMYKREPPTPTRSASTKRSLHDDIEKQWEQAKKAKCEDTENVKPVEAISNENGAVPTSVIRHTTGNVNYSSAKNEITPPKGPLPEPLQTVCVNTTPLKGVSNTNFKEVIQHEQEAELRPFPPGWFSPLQPVKMSKLVTRERNTVETVHIKLHEAPVQEMYRTPVRSGVHPSDFLTPVKTRTDFVTPIKTPLIPYFPPMFHTPINASPLPIHASPAQEMLSPIDYSNTGCAIYKTPERKLIPIMSKTPSKNLPTLPQDENTPKGKSPSICNPTSIFSSGHKPARALSPIFENVHQQSPSKYSKSPVKMSPFKHGIEPSRSVKRSVFTDLKPLQNIPQQSVSLPEAKINETTRHSLLKPMQSAVKQVKPVLKPVEHVPEEQRERLMGALALIELAQPVHESKTYHQL